MTQVCCATCVYSETYRWWMIADLNYRIKLAWNVWAKVYDRKGWWHSTCMCDTVNGLIYLFIYLKLLSVDRITQHLFVGWLINDELEIMWKEVVMTQFAVPALLLSGNPIWNSRCSGRVLKREPPEYESETWTSRVCQKREPPEYVRNVNLPSMSETWTSQVCQKREPPEYVRNLNLPSMSETLLNDETCSGL
jgi:hypothetical protein